MKTSEKPKYLQELRNLYDSIDIEKLIVNSNDMEEIRKINRVIAIFTYFSFNDGDDLDKLLKEFQKWSRKSTHTGTIRNRAMDIIQFIDKKIQQMDVYVIEDVEQKEKRIIKELEDKNYWVRSVSQGKDLHLMIGDKNSKSGEKVHFIFDSQTGEVRIDREDQSPNDLIDRVISVTTKKGETIGLTQGVKNTLEFFSVNSLQATPVLYISSLKHSGGSDGHFVIFTIKNIGKEIALDIHWGIKGFAYEWRSQKVVSDLAPGSEKEVVFPLSIEKPFQNEVSELNVFMEYKNIQNVTFFSRRELKQEKVPSGAFYNFKVNTFHSPVILHDDGLELLGEPANNGDRVEGHFKIETDSGTKKVMIGISRTFLSVWGFQTPEQTKQAILELGHRKIRRMVKDNNVQDYIFVTTDFSIDNQGGYEGYKKVRNSI